MGLEAKDKTIGEHTYRVYQLPATQGLTMFMDLAKMVGPSLGVLIDAVKSEKGGAASLSDLMGTSLQGDAFGTAIAALVERFDTAKVQDMISKLREKSEVDVSGSGNFVKLGAVYEAHFAGKIGTLLSWLRFALEVQFADFLSSLASRAPTAPSAASKALDAA